MNEQRDVTLDPDNWDAFGKLLHDAVDDMIEFLRDVRQRPVWQSVPGTAKQSLNEALPREGEGLERAYSAFRKDVLPYPTGNIHPRFWGWVMGTGTADGVLSDMLAAAMNAHVAGYDQSAALVERQVIRWMCELFGYSAFAGGSLVSGGTVANLTGLLVARRAKAGFDVRTEGVGGKGRKLVVYGSTETHSWASRSCDFIGLGERAFRRVPVDADFRIDLWTLRKMITLDRAAGLHPICVIGNAGTVNTGAVDDLHALANICMEFGLWFHVDAALGGLAVASPTVADRVSGIDRADSIAFDLHKWGYLQYELGCLLVRDAQLLRKTFASSADYLTPAGRGILPESMEFADQGIQLSRGFRALKVWMFLKAHGVEAWARLIEQNVRHVQMLAQRIEEDPRLELLSSPTLNVVCFRYFVPGVDDEVLDNINREIMLSLQEMGIAVLSSTRIWGRLALRVANANHRSQWSDFELLLEAILAIGESIEKKGEPGQ